MNKSVKIETAANRVVLIIAGLFVLTMFSIFAVWCLANAIASQSPSKDVARLTISMAPNDPQSHYALAVLDEKDFQAEDSAESLKEFEQATALAPNDYRLWTALGKARERQGDADGAELAARKASELAPNYAQVHWTLGNILLRRGKAEEGFAEMRRAAADDANYRIPLVATAWQIFDGDLDRIKRSVVGTSEMNVALALFLARQKRLDEALQIWNALPADAKKNALQESSRELLSLMFAEKKYRGALQILASVSDGADAENFAVGKIYNAGFEAELRRETATAFEWQIADGAQPQIGFDDAQKHGGNRSLVLIFNSSDGKDFRQISQMVAVEAAKKYQFETFYKADLKTAATLRWEIADASDGKILATTNAAMGNSDWTNLKTEFATGADTQAVVVRLARADCKSIVCPITGKIWFDDFSIN